MTHGSLFSGIGGFDLAAEWMGWDNVFHCEINPFGQQILKHYWPNSISYSDITQTDFTQHHGKIDIISGGFPCQPFSQAGKRQGTADSRHLWPEMCRAIREIKPRYILGENVYGLVNWNGGMVFEQVQIDLENEGYQVQPIIIPALSVNAPHRRDRIWFIAYSNGPGSRYNNRTDNQEENKIWRQNKGNVSSEFSCDGNVTDTKRIRLEYGIKAGNIRGKKKTAQTERSFFTHVFKTNGNKYAANTNIIKLRTKINRTAKSGFINNTTITNWENFPTESPVCGRNDGLPSELDRITFSKWRKESIKAYGNAVVPQVVYQIFKTIELYEKTQNTSDNR